MLGHNTIEADHFQYPATFVPRNFATRPRVLKIEQQSHALRVVRGRPRRSNPRPGQHPRTLYIHHFNAGRLRSQALFIKASSVVIDGARDELQAKIAHAMAGLRVRERTIHCDLA